MERAEVLELAVAAGIMPWIKREWNGKQLVHTDDGMDGDLACLLQFAELIVERERERAAAICHACRDHQHAPDEIAQRIVNG
jgi:ubiquinone biosynthesis protein UbiJ